MTQPLIAQEYYEQIVNKFKKYNSYDSNHKFEFRIERIAHDGFVLVYTDTTTQFQFEQTFWYSTFDERPLSTQISLTLGFYDLKKRVIKSLCNLYPELTFPFIIASGQPNKTVLTLLDRLHKQRTKILYHGDMDPAGLTIASHILNHVPIITPFMSVSEYNKQEKYPQLTSQPADIAPTFRPLLTLIQKNKQCVYEEQLDLNKCQIYYDLMI